MHKRSRLIAAPLLALGAAAAAAANLSIDFVRPESFTDAAYARSSPGPKEHGEVQRDIEQHLQQLAAGALPAEDALEIEVLDVDLAGDFEPLRNPSASDLRIMRGITWPRMTLRYTLSRAGQVIASAEDQLSDMHYLMSVNRYPDSDRLRYEKAMLDDWFARRIAGRQAGERSPSR